MSDQPSAEPNIVAKKCKRLFLNPGVYFYCRCGLSADGVFCDGAHKATSFVPKKFVIEDAQEVALCLCKHTPNAPYCDGTHKLI